jgi:hypothetical protein
MRTPSFCRVALAALATICSVACSAASPTSVAFPNVSLAEAPTADVSPRWNAIARSLIVTAKPNQQEALRAMACLSLAQHEAALELSTASVGGPISPKLTIDQDPPATVVAPQEASTGRVDRWARLRGAIAGASAEILKEMFRANVADIVGAVEREGGLSAEAGELASEFVVGLEIGRTIGVRLALSARADRFDAVWNGNVPTGTGTWYSSIGRPPALPLLGQMRPFFMNTGAGFRPGPPPAFGSNAFTTALSEIRAFSDTRTATQDSIAKFWAMATGTLVAGYWTRSPRH